MTPARHDPLPPIDFQAQPVPLFSFVRHCHFAMHHHPGRIVTTPFNKLLFIPFTSWREHTNARYLSRSSDTRSWSSMLRHVLTVQPNLIFVRAFLYTHNAVRALPCIGGAFPPFAQHTLPPIFTV
ncbi:hypothetical protein LSAT2_009737 [Lamellibrachia satsuma]|nr:hypothetical protein LSAT2_009737 [Lamellibrachia satsuma]